MVSRALFGRNGNILVNVTVIGTVLTTALLGILQMTANYSRRLSSERAISGMSDKNTLVLEYVRSKFISRGYPSSREWRVTTTDSRPFLLNTSNSASVLTATAPIRVVTSRKDSSGVCIDVVPEQLEFSGTPATNVCSYKTFIPDNSLLASIQDPASLSSGEKQQAYVAVIDLQKLSSTDLESLLNGTLTNVDSGSYSLERITFENYEVNAADGSSVLTLGFRNGDLGQVVVEAVKQIVFLESFTERLISVSLEEPDLRDNSGNCRNLVMNQIGCTGKGSATCASAVPTKSAVSRNICSGGGLGGYVVDATQANSGSSNENYFLASHGEFFKSVSDTPSRLWSDPRVSSVGFNLGTWYALTSDGRLLKSPSSSLENMTQVQCVSLPRAQILAMGSTPDLSCR